MVAYEPRVRRRGFFLHSPEGGEPDTGEHENPEGFVVRVRASRRAAMPPPDRQRRPIPHARLSHRRHARRSDQGA